MSHPLATAARALSAELAKLRFGPPVTHVYDPSDYAHAVYAAYLERYGTGKRRVVFHGMNPGPYGMTQTGVPFGEIAAVRDFLKLEGPVGQPPVAHPKRPVTGFATTRSEVSGTRVWGAIAAHWGTADAFFAGHMIVNYCPLVFMEASGRNRTPDQLPAAERAPLFALCDAHLRAAVGYYDPEWVVGIGHFAEGRARAALAGTGVKIARIGHPSPASPAANRGWAALAAGELRAQGVCIDRV